MDRIPVDPVADLQGHTWEDGPAFRLLRPTETSFRSGQCPKLGVEVGGTLSLHFAKTRCLE